MITTKNPRELGEELQEALKQYRLRSTRDPIHGIARTMKALQDAGVEVVPVYGGDPLNPAHEKRTKQKQPIHPYSSKNPLTPEIAQGELEEWLENNQGYAYGVKPNPGLIVIDADHPEEVAGLKQWWNQFGEFPGFTVTTPGLGATGEDGKRKHREGGHLYLTVNPDLFYGIEGIKKLPGGAAVYATGNRYLLGAGSRRAGTGSDGIYHLIGEVIIGEDYPGIEEALRKIFTYTPPQPAYKPPLMNANFATGEGELSTEEKAKRWSTLTPWSRIATLLGWEVVGYSTRKNCGSSCIELKHVHAGNPVGGVAHEPDCPLIRGTTTGIIWSHSETIREALPGVEWKGKAGITATKWQIVLHGVYGGDTSRMFAEEAYLEDTPPSPGIRGDQND